MHIAYIRTFAWKNYTIKKSSRKFFHEQLFSNKLRIFKISIVIVKIIELIENRKCTYEKLN